jgi:hypothetical protein
LETSLVIKELPFTLENDLEREIASDPEWQEGVEWGEPRFGHWEGPVKYHIVDVLSNIETISHLESDTEERRKLRLIALIHDAFKYQVDETKPKIGTNHHAHIARRFAERYIDDPEILLIIETHDEAYNSWRLGHYKQRWQHAEERADHLLERLGPSLPLYVRFFYADSDTESKNPEPVAWFEQYLVRRGVAL